MSGKKTSGTTVDLYLCAEPQFGVEKQKEAVIDRLTALERAELIDGFNIYIWGREIRPTGPLEGTDYHEFVLDSLRKFEEWLQRNGASEDRIFKRREVDSEFVDETYEVISLPMMCLAVYDDGELSGVYPYYDGEGTHTVRECLAGLEATTPSATVDGVTPERPRQR